jgi:BED zinc finger
MCKMYIPNTVSCRICGKNLDNENASSHMKQHDKKGEIPHSDH